MPKKLANDQSRKNARNAKDRARRAAKGLTRGDGGGADKGQGRKPNPDRPSCPHGNEICRLAMNGRDWRCRLDRGGCGASLPKQ